MTSLFMFVIATIGMTHIIVDGSITQKLRDGWKALTAKLGVPSLGELVDCYLCCGTWCGFLMGWVWLDASIWQIIAAGFAGGFLSNFAAVVLNWLEAGTIVNLPPADKEKNGN